MKNVIRKQVEIKSSDMDGNGTLKVVANRMGVLDRGNDVVFPGFFQPAIKDFLKHGFGPTAHNWDGLPVLMPTKAEERGADFYCEAKYHSTQQAQDARTVACERMENGLSVGLSVGFTPDYETGVKFFDNGAALIKYAQESGCDMALFDVKGIKACKEPVRGLLPGGCKELFEFSQVNVPMNRPSLALEAKSDEEEQEEQGKPLAVAAKCIADLAEQHTNIREYEEALRDAGASKKQAVALASAYFKTEEPVTVTFTDTPSGERSDSAEPGENPDADANRAERLRRLSLRARALTIITPDALGESFQCQPQ